MVWQSYCAELKLLPLTQTGQNMVIGKMGCLPKLSVCARCHAVLSLEWWNTTWVSLGMADMAQTVPRNYRMRSPFGYVCKLVGYWKKMKNLLQKSEDIVENAAANHLDYIAI